MSNTKTLASFATTPQLVEITTEESPHIKEKYEEDLKVWVYDELPVAKFYKLLDAQQKSALQEDGKIEDVIQQYVYNEDGTPALQKGQVLPTDITLAVYQAMVKYYVGKYMGQ